MTATTNSEQHGIEDRKQYRQMMDRVMGIGAVGLIIVTAVWWLFLPEDLSNHRICRKNGIPHADYGTNGWAT